MKETLGMARSLLTYYAIPGRLRRLRNFYRQFIQPGDLCFDIGAHVGNRMWPWTQLGARVIAVEPQPSMMRFLQRVYGRNSQITLIDKAIGKAHGTAELHISSRFPTVTTMSREWITAVKEDATFTKVEWDQTVDVEIITLDDLIAQFGKPAFCKIDIEGYELDALQGLSTPIQALSFEYIPAAIPMSIQCIERLTELGDYSYNLSTGENYRFLSPDWLTPREMIKHLNQITTDERSGDIYGRL
ncbi:MAG: FkbM family methyltransferase [Chloroflexota bacterium]